MINWTTTAFIFPGQGSQTVGMGKDLSETFPIVRQTFEQADDILGFKLSGLCFDGPENDLNDTVNTQPALYVCGIATLRVLQQEVPAAIPGFVAGHSLGEFTALAAAEAVSFEEGLRLVRQRGQLMKEAGTKSPGAMAALLGLDAENVREICARASQQTGGILILANDNCPGQSVISGDEPTIEAGMSLAREAGARKVVKLAVSIASHSPLMESIAGEFRAVLEQTYFRAPDVPVYGNVNAAPLKDGESIRHELGMQLTSSVRWTESIQAIVAAGAESFIELGPKDVLSGLTKRIDRSKSGKPVNNLETFRKLLAENQ